MNKGERNEILSKIKLVDLRDSGRYLFNEPVETVGSKDIEYSSIPNGYTIEDIVCMDDNMLKEIAKKMGIGIAPHVNKADVYINGIGVSLKSLSAGAYSLINTTCRPGIERVCRLLGIDIALLDIIISEYHNKRSKGIISEDTKIRDKECPFKNYKEYLRPLLEYFLFDGTGTKDSKEPAKYIIEFKDPMDVTTYTKLDREEVVERKWTKLVFSLRGKGMPSGYCEEGPRKLYYESEAKWTRQINGCYKGALHVRAVG